MTRSLRWVPRAARWCWPCCWLVLAPGVALAQAALPMLTEVDQVAAGSGHTCALSRSGAVLCWGRNDEGQLGDGSTSNRSLPAQVVGLTEGVIAIAAGESHSCAAKDDGSVVCWGSNLLGQLGNGTQSLAPTTTPVAVSGLTGARALALGGSHSCALRTDDALWCWGDSSFGQINLAGGQRPTPLLVSSGVSAVAAGDSHTCLLKSSGPVQCVGYALFGQLGRGDNPPFIGDPTLADVIGLQSGVSAIGLGSQHSCATLQVGGLRCWGNNEQRQIGNDSSSLRFGLPQAVTGIASVQLQVVGGADFSCALDGSGAVACWGSNVIGQAGTGAETQFYPVPTAVQGLPAAVRQLSAGDRHVCAVTVDDALLCWGDNTFGQTGGGDVDPLVRASPVEVAGLSDAVQIAAGAVHTCATSAGGAVRCWGSNASGQLGDGSTTRRLGPVDVFGLGSGMRSVSAGESHSCAIALNGELRCWGNNRSFQLATGSSAQFETRPVSLSGLFASGGATAGFTAPLLSLSAGNRHSCALTSQGRVGCWGAVPLGRSDRPVFLVELLSNIAAVGAGNDHNCALTTAGVVRCWGDDSVGQIVNGGTDSPFSAVDVHGIGEPARLLAVRRDHSCAATDSHRVVCWGSDQFGEGGSIGPITVAGLSGPLSALTAGLRHNCALSAAGGVRCWGDNAFGQLGNGGAAAPARTAVPVEGLASGVTAISAGEFHTCALLATGRVRCWGSSGGAQLGEGRLPGGVALPRSVRIDPAFFRSGFEAGEG